MRENRKTSKTIRPNQQNTRPTFGFLTPGIQVDSRFYDVWVGIVEGGRERDVNLICFSVGRAYDEASLRENKHKVLFDLITPERLDGLITFEWWDVEQFERVCCRYRPLPIVNVMRLVDGYYCVSLNFADVMRVKLQHLIDVHGYRRIAYLRGPESKYSAQVQYQTYVEVLTEYGLPLDLALTVPFPLSTEPERDREFNFKRGREAIRVLLDERQIKPGQDVEAILGVDDELTWGALHELQQRGIRVPYDVAVVGSGGQEESRFTKPPLTTAAPLYYEMGRKAVEVLLLALAGEPVAEHTVLPVRLHVRRSCGCLSPSITRAAADTIRDSGESFQTMVAAPREQILSAMEQAVGGRWEHLEGWADRLLAAFVAEVMKLSGESFTTTSPDVAEAGQFIATGIVETGFIQPGFIQTGFIQTLEEILYQVDCVPGDVRIGHDVLSALRAQLLPCLSHDVNLWGQADNLWQQGRVLVHTIALESQRRWQAQKDRQATVLWEIGQRLINTFGVVGVMNVLAEGLPRLGIPGCYLSLYEHPATPVEGARLMLAYNGQARFEVSPDGQRFRSAQLVPAGILPQNRCFSLVVEPLYFGENQIGFVVFETTPRDERTIYDILRGEISSALGGALLIQERKRAEETLAKLATELEIVAQVSTAASTILDTAELLQGVVDLTKDSFGLYHAHIYLLDDTPPYPPLKGEGGRVLVLAAGAGAVGWQMVAEGWSIPLEREQSLVARVARTRQGVIVNNVRKEPGWLFNPLLPNTCSELAVPLMVGDRVLGVLDVQADEVDYFTDNDIRIQATLAAQVAVALENARLFEQAEQEIVERKRAEMALAQQAQILDAELERFFHVASHHLQEPLRMVTSYSQLLIKRYGDKLGPEAGEFVAYVVDGAARIRDLLNDVLTYSLVATHGRPFEPTDCNVLLDRVLAGLKVVIIEESGAVVSHDDLPTVMADRRQLAQLFENLIDNAFKFRSEESPQIHIGVEHKEGWSQEEDAYWMFSVRDNGIGIETLYFERIFMIFQQLHAWKEYKGTGIGLAICKKIVDRHGGRIWVESEPGQGSTFYFTIPDREETSFEESSS